MNKIKHISRRLKPLKISESLKNINQKIVYKFGKIEYVIHSKWCEIVGKFFANHSEPEKIISLPVNSQISGEIEYNKILSVNVTPAAALEFNHFKDKIIEKINSFFGYRAIHDIKITQKTIKQAQILKNKKYHNKQVVNEKMSEIKKTTSKISDKELKQVLSKLGLSISEDKQ